MGQAARAVPVHATGRGHGPAAGVAVVGASAGEAPGVGGVSAQLRVALRDRLGTARFDRYFGDGAGLELVGEEVRVAVPSRMIASLIEKHFGPVLSLAAGEALRHWGRPPSQSPRVVIRIQEPATTRGPALAHAAGHAVGQAVGHSHEGAPAGPIAFLQPRGSEPTSQAGPRKAAPIAGAMVAQRAPGVAASPAGPARGVAPLVSRPKHRWSEFVVGECNRVALATLRRMLDQPQEPATPRLAVVHGACGTGKTHLLAGMIAEALAVRPEASARYLTAEAMANEFIGAVRKSRADVWRRQVRSLDLLCVDDLGCLVGKPATQNELQQTIDAIASRGGRVVIATPEHPKRLRGLTEALVSRLTGGMVAALGAPDTELSGRVLQALAARKGLALEPGAAAEVIAHVGLDGTRPLALPRASVRDLEGVVARIEAAARVIGPGEASGGGAGLVRVGHLVVQAALRAGEGPAGKSEHAPGGPRPVRMEQILHVVSHALSVTLEDLRGVGRAPRVVVGRALVAHLARRLTPQSYPEIARALGRENHSTVITAHQRLAAQLQSNASVGLASGQTVPLLSLRDRLLAELGGRVCDAEGQAPVHAEPPAATAAGVGE